MQVLEKILQEIGEIVYPAEGIGCGMEDLGIDGRYEAAAYGWDEAVEIIDEIIRSHMEDEPVSNPNKLNDGWIPVKERLPEPGEIVLVQQIYSWEHFEEGAMVTVGRLRPVEDGRMPYWEFQYYRPDFLHGTIMDNGIICPGSEYITHWQPLPAPYQPKEERV